MPMSRTKYASYKPKTFTCEKREGGMGAYCNSVVVDCPADSGKQRLLIQASHANENHQISDHCASTVDRSNVIEEPKK